MFSRGRWRTSSTVRSAGGRRRVANYGLMYTGLFNLLAMPCGVVPATRVRAGEEHTSRGRDSVEQSFARTEQQSEGLPIGIHVAARWWREDLTLAMMKRLEDHFQRTPTFPRTPLDPAANAASRQMWRRSNNALPQTGPPTGLFQGRFSVIATKCRLPNLPQSESAPIRFGRCD